MLTIIRDAISENVKELISFDMILCNKKTFIKALKVDAKVWEELKREFVFDYFKPKPPKYMRLFGYPFGVNKESENLDDNEFAFLNNCQFVSKYKDGKLEKMNHPAISGLK